MGYAFSSRLSSPLQEGGGGGTQLRYDRLMFYLNGGKRKKTGILIPSSFVVSLLSKELDGSGHTCRSVIVSPYLALSPVQQEETNPLFYFLLFHLGEAPI